MQPTVLLVLLDPWRYRNWSPEPQEPPTPRYRLIRHLAVEFSENTERYVSEGTLNFLLLNPASDNLIAVFLNIQAFFDVMLHRLNYGFQRRWTVWSLKLERTEILGNIGNHSPTTKRHSPEDLSPETIWFHVILILPQLQQDTQLSIPTHAQLQCHRLKFIKNRLKKTPTCFGLRPPSGSYNVLAKITIIIDHSWMFLC